MLQLKNATKIFNPRSLDQKIALNQLSLDVEEGDFITILGGNGAGKSTLFNAICGTFLLDSGSIILDGKDITKEKEHKRARVIGRLFQDPLKGTAPSMTIEENLSLALKGGFFHRSEKANTEYFKEALSMLDLGIENRLKAKVGLLSGGQRQAVTLLMSTIVTPKLLLLDEHTAALDPATAKKVLQITNEIVGKNQITTLMITHNIKSALKVGNRTIMLEDGRVVLDVKGKERDTMSVNGFLALYSKEREKELDNDRVLLSSIKE